MVKFATKCHQSYIIVNFEDDKLADRDNKYI